jgi:CBS domain-containing protein
MRLGEIMTDPVVTADAGAPLRHVGELMRDRNVGSVVVCDAGEPVALVTDRDVALAVAADGVDPGDPVGPYATRPLVTGEPDTTIEEAAALMVQHRIRRLPVLAGRRLVGIVTIDDVAVRAGDLEIAQRMTADVARGALPEFYFHQRGG